MEESGEGEAPVEKDGENTKMTSDQDPVAGTSSSISDNISTSKEEKVGEENLSLDGVELESIIRRPSKNGSKKRNYRQTTGIDTTSSSGDEEPKSASSRMDEDSISNIITHVDKMKTETTGTETGEVEVRGDEGAEGTLSSLPGPSSCSNSENVAKADTDSKPLIVGEEDDDHMSTSSNLPGLESPSFPPRGPLSSDDSSSSSDHSDFRPQLAYYPGGVEIEDSNTSSSSSSLEFMEDEDEDELEDDDTSDSSDSLDDLEDRPVGSNRNTTPGQHIPEGSTKNRLRNKSKNQKDQPLPQVLSKPKAKCDWSGPKAISQRQMGYRTRIAAQGAEIFRQKFYGSLFSAERLELAKKLDGHDGCVNCLHFNYAGTKLASGSDDLEIKIWNYGFGNLLTSFNSKHRSNVFQAKFMPLIGLDNVIASCARDCQVRLTELDSSGSVASSRKLAQHRGPVHKLAINPETPHIVLSCGEDGVVMSCDIREDKSQKILSLVEGGRRLSLYSIHSNPLISHEFCVAGRDEYVRLFDTRKMSRSSTSSGELGTENENATLPLKRFCPHHLQGNQSKPHITAAVYNYCGSEIIASYNDENIYLFDTSHSDLADSVACYEGHLNSATVKGVNFFGEKSQFVISGSDDNKIFIWDRKSESIVNFFRGDEKGVVNCLEPHPSAPILATSGLDDDIKIWIPSSETPPKMGELAATVKKNIRKRNEEIASRPNALDGQIMWQLINHLQNEQRRNRRTAGEANSDSSSDEDVDGEGADSSSRGIECVIA